MYKLKLHVTLVAGALLLAAANVGQAQPAAAVPLALRASDPALQWGACPPIFPRGCRIAVLHGDPAKPNADVFLRVDGGQKLPAHIHSSAERMILVSGQLTVKYKGAQAANLTPGMYAYGPPGLAHEASCLGAEPCTLFIAFEGAVDANAFAGSLD